MIPCVGLQTNRLACAAGLVLSMAAVIPAASAAGELPISGRVVDTDGAPIHGAVVEVLPRLGSWDRLRHRLDGSEVEAADRTFSGLDGRFELPAQPLGLWTLRVRAEDQLDAHWHLPPTWTGGWLEELTMLSTNQEVSIQVLDAEGNPVEGAEVDVAFAWGGNPWSHSAAFPAQVTDARGRVHLPSPASPTQDPRAIHDPRQTRRIQAVARISTGVGRWQTSAVGALEGPGQLTLRVDRRTTSTRLMFQGRPLSGAAFVDALGPVALSEEDGRVVLPDLGRDWLLSLRLATQDRVVGWTLASTDPLEIDIHPPTTWTGQVVSNVGEPIADAAVFSHWRQAEPLLVRTDRQGVYSVSVPPDLFTLGVGAVGYLPTRVRVDHRHRGANAEEVVHLPRAVLAPSTRVEARVVDPADRPLEDVQVEVLVQQIPNDSRRRESWLARTDVTGLVVLRGLAPGAVALALLKKNGFALREVSFEVPSELSEGSPLTWIMEPGIQVFGRTVDEDGRPVAGTAIELKPLATEDIPKEIRYARGMGERLSATSATDGSFTFSRVSTGPFRLRAEAEGLLEAAVLLELEMPGPQDLGDIELDAGLTLEGTVIEDETGDGFPQMEVVARAEYRGVIARAVTDTEGEFTLKGLPEQEVSIYPAAGNEYRGSGATVRPPFPESVELRLFRASGISGWVVDVAGVPVADAYVKIVWTHETGGLGSRSGPSEDGYFEYKGSGEGMVVVTASAPEHGSGRVKAVIGRGEQRELTVVLRPGVPLSGVVLDRGEAVTKAEVFVAMPDGMEEDWQSVPPRMLSAFSDLRTAVDADGRFNFPSIEPSTVNLLVNAEGYETYRRDVDLRSGGADLTVELERLAAVRGILLDAWGRPLPRVRVKGSSGVMRAETVTEADGTFALAVGELNRLQIHAPNGPSLVRREPGAWIEDGFLRFVVPESTAEVSATIFGLDETQLARTSLHATGELDDGWESNAPGTLQPHGSGAVRGLYPGRWTVTAKSGELQRSEVVEVAAGELRHVELNFSDDVDLLLSVEIDGEPAIFLIVEVEPEDGPDASCRTDSLGRCLLSGLKLGAARLRLRQGRSGLQHSQWLKVTGAAEDRIVLQTCRIAGRVEPARPGPVLLRQGDHSVTVWAGEDGTFDFHTAFVGQAELRAEVDDAGAHSGVVVELVPGTELTGIVLTLPESADD